LDNQRGNLEVAGADDDRLHDFYSADLEDQAESYLLRYFEKVWASYFEMSTARSSLKTPVQPFYLPGRTREV
jgi:hypothetical protein